MSYGILMCSKCKREIHQDGPNYTWLHCEDKTPICHWLRAYMEFTRDEDKTPNRISIGSVDR